MAGTIKLDGATFLEKDGGNYKITNTELKLKSSGNTIVDSSGNAVLSESGGNVSIGAAVVGGVPAGAIMSFAMSSAPTGWVVCNGAEYAIADYGDLYTAIGTTWGALTNGSGGAGSTHFRVPDLQGAFLRGSGNGTINARTKAGGSVGDFTEDQLQNATGSAKFNGVLNYSYESPVTYTSGVFTSSGSHASQVARKGSGAVDDDNEYLNFSLSNSARTGTETHPYNATVLYCIKY